MVYPKINHFATFTKTLGAMALLGFYSYNYTMITYNLKLKAVRYGLPFVLGLGFFNIFRYASSYR